MTSIKKKDKNPPFRAVLLPLGTDAANRNRYQKFTSHILNFYIYSNRGEEQLRSQILLDAGCKRSSNLDFVNPEKLDAIFLSHSHFDHTRFIGLLIRHLKKTGRVRELPLVCRPNAWRRVKWIIKAFNFSIPEFLQYIPVNLQIFAPCLNSRTKESQTDFSQTVDLTNLPLGKELEVKSKAAPAKHSKNSVAYRFWVFSNRKDNRKTKSLCLDLVFTPDTSFQSTHLVSFAKNATHWMLDCTRQPDFIENTYQKYLKGKRGVGFPAIVLPIIPENYAKTRKWCIL